MSHSVVYKKTGRSGLSRAHFGGGRRNKGRNKWKKVASLSSNRYYHRGGTRSSTGFERLLRHRTGRVRGRGVHSRLRARTGDAALAFF